MDIVVTRDLYKDVQDTKILFIHACPAERGVILSKVFFGLGELL